MVDRGLLVDDGTGEFHRPLAVTHGGVGTGGENAGKQVPHREVAGEALERGLQRLAGGGELTGSEPGQAEVEVGPQVVRGQCGQGFEVVGGSGGFAGLEQHGGQQPVRFDRSGVEPDDLLEFGAGAGGVAGVGPGPRPHEPPLEILRIDVGGPLQVQGALGSAAGPAQQEGEIEVGRSVLGVRLDRPSQVLLGRRLIAGLDQGAGEVEVDFRIATVLGQEFPIQGDRLVVSAGAGGAHRAVEPGLGFQAIDLEPVPEGIDDGDRDLAVARQLGAGPVGVAARPQGHSEVVVDDASFGLRGQYLLEGGDRLGDLAPVQRHPAETEARRGAFGPDFEHPRVGCRGRVEIAGVEMEVTAADQGRRVVRAQCERGAGREPGALQVAGGVVEQQLVVGPLEVVRRQQAELRQADGGGAVEFVVEILQAEVAEDVRGVLRLLVGGGDSEGAGRGGSVGGELLALLGVEVVEGWRRQGVDREQGADLAGVFGRWRILGRRGRRGHRGGEREAEEECFRWVRGSSDPLPPQAARETTAVGRRFSPACTASRRQAGERVRGPAHPAEESQGGASRRTVW